MQYTQNLSCSELILINFHYGPSYRRRYHESPNNLISVDVYFSRSQTILKQ